MEGRRQTLEAIGRLKPHEIVANYRDISLTKQDWNTIDHEISGDVIDFHMEFLRHELLPQCPNIKPLLVNTGSGLLISRYSKPREYAKTIPWLEPITQWTHVLLPVSNAATASTMVIKPGEDSLGSHWSMLLVCLKSNKALHYDTVWVDVRSANDKAARLYVEKLPAFLNRSRAFEFIPMEDTPAQGNGEDCGPLACMIMEHLIKELVTPESQKIGVAASVGNFEMNAEIFRQWFKELVVGLRTGELTY